MEMLNTQKMGRRVLMNGKTCPSFSSAWSLSDGQFDGQENP